MLASVVSATKLATWRASARSSASVEVGGTINPKTGKAATPGQRIEALSEILAKRDVQLSAAEDRLRKEREGARADRARIHELMQVLMVARALLEPLRRIGQAYHDNALDDAARKYWGLDDNRHENAANPKDVVLYSGRGGKELLTLADCLGVLAEVPAIEKQTGELVAYKPPANPRGFQPAAPEAWCAENMCPTCPMISRGCSGLKKKGTP